MLKWKKLAESQKKVISNLTSKLIEAETNYHFSKMREQALKRIIDIHKKKSESNWLKKNGILNPFFEEKEGNYDNS